MLVLLAMLWGLSGCDKNPVTTEETEYSKLSVLVLDESGNPQKGIRIRLVDYPRTNIIEFTDEKGQAVFENMKTGLYFVRASRSNIQIFFTDVLLTKFKEEEMTLVVATEVTINVAIKDISGNPIKNTEVYTDPNTTVEISDDNGIVNFRNVPIQKYKFLVKRNNVIVFEEYKSFEVIDSNIADIEIVVENGKPYINILAPQNNDYMEIFNVHFIGEGYDFEDGDLPDSAFSWHSNIDGELGIGKDLTIDRLSIGTHVITLSVIDSNQEISIRRLVISLHYYDPESYFPLPWEGNWKYRHQIPEFTLINTDGKQEIWTLEDLEVSTMSKDRSRKSLMRYSIKTEDKTTYCEYYVKDYFEMDLENIFVTETVEKFKTWNTDTYESNPFSQLDAETVYLPRMTVINNYTDPLSASSSVSNITTDVNWTFESKDFKGINHAETMQFENYVDIGGMETIETDFGTFEAAVITFSQGESEKKWWLAKGIGLVRLDYNTFDTPITALLYDSNILDYKDDGSLPIQKNISKSLNSGGNTLLKTLKSPPDTPEKTLEIIEILRGLSPR
ncbi:hypothetical protein ACFL6K_02745 [Candidatus Latescibacterota bacterium]